MKRKNYKGQAEEGNFATFKNSTVGSERVKGGLALKVKRIFAIFATLCLLVVMVGGAFCYGNNSSQLFAKAYNSTVDGSSADMSADGDLLATAADSAGGTEATYNLSVLQYVAKAGGYTSLAKMMVDARKGNLKDASDFLTNPEDGSTLTNGITIKFGGLEWMPVYLTTDKSGDVVLDLMLATSETTVNGVTTNETAKWNTWFCIDRTDPSAECQVFEYPSNMYSSSYIRSVLMNTNYTISGAPKVQATSNDEVALTTSGIQSTKWSTFLKKLGWDEASGTCYALDTPSQIAYQETETSAIYRTKSYTGAYTCPNEAYGTPITGYYKNSNLDFANANPKDGYDSWQYDYLWLPSLAEIGTIKNAGMWKLTNAQLENNGGTWTRTGGMNNASYAYIVDDSGDHTSDNNVATAYGVRPAIHLNLTKVTGYQFIDEPQNTSVTYTGTNINNDIVGANATWFDGDIMDITFPAECKNVGTYDCTVTIPEDSKYFFEDGEKTADIALTITPAPLKVTVTVDDSGTVTTDVVGMVNGEEKPNLNIIYKDIKTNKIVDESNLEPGIYEVGAELSDASSNYVIAQLETDEYVLKEKSVDGKNILVRPVLTQNTFVYSGLAVNIGEYLSGLNLDCEALGGDTSPINAGSYTVTVSINDGVDAYWEDGLNNDKNGTLSYKYAITKAPLKVVVKVDDESGQVATEVTGVVNGEPTPALKIIYTDVYGNVVEDISAAEPGYYVVSAELENTSENYEIAELETDTYTVYKEEKDSKLVLATPVLTENTFVYSGLDVNISDYLKGLNLEYEELSGSATAKNVGTYTVTVAIKSDVTAYWADGANDDTNEPISYKYTITKAPLKVVVKVDDESGAVTTEVIGMVNGEDAPALKIIYTNVETGKTVAESNLTVGIYEVSAKLTTTKGNYEITQLETDYYTIAADVDPDAFKVTLAKPILTQNEFVYSGKEVNIINYLEGLNLEYEVLSGDTNPVGVGGYSISVAIRSNMVAYWADGGSNSTRSALTYNFSITQAPIDVAVYVDDFGNVSTEVTGMVNSEPAPELVLNYANVETKSVVDGLANADPGEYIISADLADKGGNYYIANNKSAKYIIEAEVIDGRMIIAKPILTQNEFVYSGKSVDIKNYLEVLDFDFEDVTGDTNPVNAGTYTVYVSLKDDMEAYWEDGADNTSKEQLSFTYVIKKAPIKVVVVVNDENNTITTEVTGMVNGEPAPELTLVYKDENGDVVDDISSAEPGIYEVSAAILDVNSNYEITQLETDELTITEEVKDNKLVIAKPELKQNEFVYSGENVNIVDYFEALDADKENITGTLTAKNAGTYTVTISFKDGVTAFWADGNNDDTNAPLIYTYAIKKAPLSVVVTVNDDGTVTTEVTGMVNDEPEPELTLVYKDKDGNVIEDISTAEPGVYEVSAVLSDVNSNYEITQLETDELIIKEEVKDDKLVLAKPTLTQNTFVYSGQDVYIQNFFELFDIDKEDLSGDLQAKNAGTYTVTISIKQGVTAFWADGANDDTNGALTYTYAITKAPLKVVVTVNDDGTITTEVTGVVNDEPEPELTLVYKDKDGNVVDDISTAEPGVYEVSAILSDVNSNYEITQLETDDYVVEAAEEDGKLVIAKPVLTQNTFVYSGLNVNIQDYFEALDFDYVEISGTLSAINAGEYTVTVNIKSDVTAFWSDGANNDTNGTLTYTYTITKAPLTVVIKVNDDDNTVTYEVTGVVNGEPEPEITLVYKDENGNVIEDISTAEPGVYEVSAILSDTDSNYEITQLETDDYIIKSEIIDGKLVIAKPVLTQNTFVYSGLAVNIQEYFEALNSQYEEVTGHISAVNVGEYTVTVSIREGVVAFWADGKNDDTSSPINYKFYITKAPLKVVVTVDDEGNVTTEVTGMVNDESAPELKLVYKDGDGNIIEDVTDLIPDTYTIEAVIADENSNYEIADLTPAEYEVEGTILTKPTLTKNEFTYTGKTIDITNYIKDFNKDYEVISGDISVVNVGEYSVTIAIKEGTGNTCWADGDRSPLVYTFKIVPAKIKDDWVTNTEGIPSLPDDEDKITYIYYDKDGNPVVDEDGNPATKDDLKPGETYKVQAVVNDENKGNYVFESNGKDKTDLIEFTVLAPAELEVPTLENSHLIYNGEEQTVVLIGYESEYMIYDPIELTQIDPNNYVITISIRDDVYAEWADGQPGIEREIAFEIGKAPLASVWEFVNKSPDLIDLPSDANVAYTIKDINGNVVDAANIKEGEQYMVTAVLSDGSQENYYFAENKSDSVVTFFTYQNSANSGADGALEDMLPIWSILIIVVALVGGAVAWTKVASNIREHNEDKRAQQQHTKTSAFAGGVLLAIFGLNVKLLAIVIAVAIVACVVALIIARANSTKQMAVNNNDNVIKTKNKRLRGLFMNDKNDDVGNMQNGNRSVKIKRFIALFVICALLAMALFGMLANKSAGKYVFADEVTTTQSEDDGVSEAAASKTPLESNWQFVGKVPLLQNLPEDAAITYAVHDLNGAEISEKDIVNDGKYSVTATLSTASAQNYYFEKTGTGAVSMFFVYNDAAASSADGANVDYSAIWAVLIITLALIGLVVVIIKMFINLHDNAQNNEQKTTKTSAFAGFALLALLGIPTKVWMILAFVAVVLFFIGVIVMLITWRRHSHQIVTSVANSATNIYVNNSYSYLASIEEKKEELKEIVPVPVIVPEIEEEEEDEVVVEDATGKRKRAPSNFRVRLKASSDKCKDYYVQLKNYISGYRDVNFRMIGNVEKVIYQDEMLVYIGTTKKSLKLWLALNPADYDEEVYHQKDVSDKKRYEMVPMLIKVGSARALGRAKELIEIILTKHNAEQKTRHADRDLQLLAYTLGRNALVKDKRTELLRLSVHVHDADVLTTADADKYLETRKSKEVKDESKFATITLDAIDSKFLDGQRVTLDKLKKKELVPAECNGVRITAGTRLTKPLYIIADDYSLSAVKMIVLTGGRAIKLVEDK